MKKTNLFEFTYSDSHLEFIKGVGHLKLDEENHYKNGFAAGTIFSKAHFRIIDLLKNPILKIILTLLYLKYKNRLETIRFPQEYHDELRGYADSTKIPFKHLLLLNLIYEIVGCSSFAFFNKDGSLLVGHNTDEREYMAGFIFRYIKPLVFCVKIPGKEIFTHISGPLFVGALNGFNESGIVIASHYVDGAHKKVVEKNFSTGCFARTILENASDLKIVREIAENDFTYMPANFLVVSFREKKITTLEVYPSDHNFSILSDHKAMMTNHFQSSRMRQYHQSIFKGSLARFACFEKIFSGKDNLSVLEAISVMKNHRNGLRRHDTGFSITNAGTFQSFVFALPRGDTYISNGEKLPVSLYGELIKITSS